jgi:hypothetical protein
MTTQIASEIEAVFRYVESLLQERQRQLMDLDRKYRLRNIQPDEYLSCRRSLLQAMRELAALVRPGPRCDRGPSGKLRQNG